MKITRLLLVFWLLPSLFFAQSFRATAFSPDKKLKLTVILTPAGEPVYSLDFRGKRIVGESKLGLLAREADFSKGWKLSQTRTSSHDETWKPVWGEESEIRNRYTELVYVLHKFRPGQQTESDEMEIRFRVFNDGLGFRYEFPFAENQLVQRNRKRHFTKEITEFRMTADHTCWWNPLDWDSNEHTYHQTRLSAIDVEPHRHDVEPFNQLLPVQHGVNTPVTMRSADGTHLSIAEADLTDYGAMQLEIDRKSLIFRAHVIPTADTSVISVNELPFKTPWRCVLVSPDAGGILKNRIILNLNDPCALEGDLSWIKPQKYVGVWWEMHVGKSTWNYAESTDSVSVDGRRPTGKHGATTENVKTFIDFAAKHGFSGVLVEGWNEGWEDWFGKMKPEVFNFTKPYPDYDVAELSRYAKEKGVKIIMHHETSAAVPSYERQMDDAYVFMKNHGMNTVKTGYVGRVLPKGELHDGQWMVNHYLRVAERTGKNNLMVNMHESMRPSGHYRTYPNWLACEAARGQEFNAWSKGNAPDHEIVLAFTRLLGGPMDYTPGIFQIHANQFDKSKKEQVHTTVAKQLALYVTLYSPLQMAADLPMNYEKRPDVFQFIKDVPVEWDETRILNASIGDYLTTARRQKGTENWFVGSITDENERSFSLQLDFLKTGKNYVATIYEDGPGAHWQTNPYPVNIRKVKVRKGQSLKLKLAASGGAAISIVEQ